MKRKTSNPIVKPGKPKLQRQGGQYGQALVGYYTSVDEKKEANSNTATTIVFGQTAAVVTNIVGIAQGVTSTTRSGRRVTMTSLHYRWLGHLAPTTTGASPLRLLIVYDKQANAASPAATDVLINDNIYAEMNLNNSRRFKVIVDELIPCNGTAGPQAWQVKGWRDFTAKGTKKGLEIEFNNASNGNVTDIITGSLTALTYQDGGLLIASPVSTLYTRVRFLDP